MITRIETIEDIIVFAKEVVAEGTNIHPDDDFNNVINIETNEPVYSSEEAAKRNELMVQCFSVCEREGIDIYETMLEVYLKETNLNQFIPLPSSLI